MSGELPEGWAIARIGDVFEVNPRKPAADHVREDAPVSFVPMGAVDADRGAITAPEERTFGAVRKGYTAFADGDVLLAKITPCFENGKAAVASSLRNGLGFGSSEFHVFRPQGAVLAPYLFYFLRQPQLRAEAAEFMTGTAGQARVPIDYLRDLELPIPPLAEQHRIVDKVEALLEQVRRAKDRLDRVPLILKRFRQAVLAAACSGKLTEEWRDLAQVGRDREGGSTEPCYVPDREVPELPDGWHWRMLRSLVGPNQVFCYGVVQPGKDDPQGVPLIRSGDLHDLRAALPKLRRIPTEIDSAFHRSRIVGGEVLVTVVGANIGTVALAPPEAAGFNIARAVAKVPVSGALPEFVLLCLRTTMAYRWMVGDSREVARPTLNLEQLGDIPMPIPPLSEQAEIVRRVDALFALATAIGERVERATGRARILPQAILSKAFAGELVPTEADLARAEGRDYETAEQLLERAKGVAVEHATSRRRSARA